MQRAGTGSTIVPKIILVFVLINLLFLLTEIAINVSRGHAAALAEESAMTFIEGLAALVFVVMTVGFLVWVAWLAISK